MISGGYSSLYNLMYLKLNFTINFTTRYVSNSICYFNVWFSCCLERVDRIKEAKSEAEALIAAYRAEMEANFQKKINLVCKIKLSSSISNSI